MTMINSDNTIGFYDAVRRDYEWLGEVTHIHSIGEYQIVEYVEKSKWGGNIMFGVYVDGKNTRHSYGSLDSAIVGAIAYKHEGCNHRADGYFMAMIKQN